MDPQFWNSTNDTTPLDTDLESTWQARCQNEFFTVFWFALTQSCTYLFAWVLDAKNIELLKSWLIFFDNIIICNYNSNDYIHSFKGSKTLALKHWPFASFKIQTKCFFNCKRLIIISWHWKRFWNRLFEARKLYSVGKANG